MYTERYFRLISAIVLLFAIMISLPLCLGAAGRSAPRNAAYSVVRSVDQNRVAIASISRDTPSAEVEYMRQTAYATWILAFGTLILVVVTAIMMGRQVADARMAVQLQLFLQLVDWGDSDSMRKSRDKVARAVLDGEALNDSCAQNVLDGLERVAYLAKKGHLDIQMVYNEFVNPVCSYWLALTAYIQNLRSRLNQADVYDNLEWLFTKLMEMDKKSHGGPSSENSFSRAVVLEYMRAELDHERPPPT